MSSQPKRWQPKVKNFLTIKKTFYAWTVLANPFPYCSLIFTYHRALLCATKFAVVHLETSALNNWQSLDERDHNPEAPGVSEIAVTLHDLCCSLLLKDSVKIFSQLRNHIGIQNELKTNREGVDADV